MINLISDTVTHPTQAMREAMINAPVGDDVFKADPTINALQEKAARMFGKEAALFCPSGTMCNQIAISVHTRPMDEVICDKLSHVYQSENGGYAFNSWAGIKLIDGNRGKITAAQVEAAINPPYDWLPHSRMVVLENSCNIGGGTVYHLEEMKAVSDLCKARDLRLHLDGARLFNALEQTGDKPHEVGALFDSISICLSKGLGAPVGSLLLGDEEFIHQARRVRKARGGGMRQAGILAAAGIYALDHHVERLADDHRRARAIGKVLATLPFVENIRPIETNLMFFDVKSPMTAQDFLDELKAHNILAVSFGPQTVRFVTHLDFTEKMLEKTLEVLKRVVV